MKFTDVVELTQNAVSQTLGDVYMGKDGKLAPLTSFNLVDVGKDVLDSGSVDSYVKALLTQMGKMIIESEVYKAELPSLFIDSFDWGGYIERVYFSPQDLLKDDMYDLVDGKVYEDHKFYRPNVSAKIFEEGKTISCPISITEDQIKMSFNSYDDLNRFLSGIYQNVQNTITLGLEAYAHMLISAGIAVTIGSTGNTRHLATEFYGESGKTKKITEMLKDGAFLKFCMEQIALVKDQMKRYTTAFNNASVPTFTTDNDLKVALLADFANSVKFNVTADTFHADEIGLGKFDKVTAWQAFSEDALRNFDVETNSSISISADTNNKLGIGVKEFNAKGVIGIVYDYRAMGICPFRTKVTSNYTASADFWNQYHHQLVNYILDSNFNMVSFVLD